MGKFKFTEEQELEIRRKYESSRASTSQLAKEYECSANAIKSAIKRAGGKLRSVSESQLLFTPEQRKQIRYKYENSRITLSKLSEEYGCSKTAIRNAIVRANGVMRSNSAAPRLFRLFTPEQELEICSIYQQGSSIRFIARQYSTSRDKIKELLNKNEITIRGGNTGTLEERLWSKVSMKSLEGCWEFAGSRNIYGYGVMTVGKGRVGAHRIAYQLTHGPIPEGLVVRHDCDNPACCNPWHLRTGTTADNMRDKVERGRQLRGEENPVRKLTESQVLEIRSSDKPSGELAERFGVTPQAVQHARSGRNWKHLPGAKLVGQRRKFNDQQVKEIYLSTEKGVDLAKRFRCHTATISAIRRGRIYGSLTKWL